MFPTFIWWRHANYLSVSTFGHVLSPHGRDMHLPKTHQVWCKYVCPIRSYWHFPKSNMVLAAILYFQVMWIWHCGMLIVWHLSFCTKSGSNICYSHSDRRTYSTKFGADIFIQHGVVDIFPKLKMAAAAIFDFQVQWIWHIQARWKCSAWALYQIFFKHLL